MTKEVQPQGTVMGTVGYMSPEQAKGQAADFRSDQFAFGAILYEMVTGKMAFKRDSSIQTLSAIIEQEPEPIAAIHPETPPHLRVIVERCLAKSPEERYDSTRDLATGIEEHRGNGFTASSAKRSRPLQSATSVARRSCYWCRSGRGSRASAGVECGRSAGVAARSNTVSTN